MNSPLVSKISDTAKVERPYRKRGFGGMDLLAWSNGLRVEAKRTGNYERAEAAEGYVVERNLGPVDKVSTG